MRGRRLRGREVRRALRVGPGEEVEKSKKIREFKREMRRRPIAGDIYTQATSIEEEINGIIDAATGELLVEPGLLDSNPLR